MGRMAPTPLFVLRYPAKPTVALARAQRPTAPYVSGEIIVKLRAGVQVQTNPSSLSIQSANSVDDLVAKLGVTQIKPLFADSAQPPLGSFSTQANQPRVMIFKLPKGTELSAAQIASRNAAIEYAEPNYLYELSATPNDPYFGSQGSWGQDFDDLYGLKLMSMANAWDQTRGDNVIVAVIDSGIDPTHEDLAANLWTNTAEIPDNGIDDDGNGYVDDVYGWDFVDSDGEPQDGNGHGTHVAGTIAAVGDNQTGVIGVAPRARIMALKGLSDSGRGSTAGLARALRLCHRQRRARHQQQLRRPQSLANPARRRQLRPSAQRRGHRGRWQLEPRRRLSWSRRFSSGDRGRCERCRRQARRLFQLWPANRC
jgi:hypothetical protein